MTERKSTDGSSIRSRAIHWAVRLRSGDISIAEHRALNEWLQQDESHLHEFQRIQNWLGELRVSAPETFPEIERARKLRSRMRPRAIVLAASIVIMIMGGLWVATDSQSVESFRTGKGERTSINLADGSQITLNTDTDVVVRISRFSRKISLNRGEALFTVAHGTGMPFEVSAGRGTIRDLGTRFSVHQESGVVTVTVVEGRVAVWTENKSDARRLEANDQLSFDESGRITPIVKVDAELLTAWNRDWIYFKRTPLAKIFSEIERYHNIRIEVDDNRVNSIRVNGRFRISDVDGLLKAIEALLPVKLTSLPGLDGQRIYRVGYISGNPSG